MHSLSLAKSRAPASTEDDASLVKAARRDPAAFAALYRRHVTPVYRYLYSRVGNTADAEDLTAQVFTEALEGLGRYREVGSFATLTITSIAIAAVIGPYVGAGGAGRFLKPGMGGLSGSYANPRRGFAIIVLLALAVDVLLGVLQILFTPRSSLEE